jgi:hypothetical protein
MRKHEFYDNVYYVGIPVIVDPYDFKAIEMRTYKDTLENVVKRNPYNTIYVYSVDEYQGLIRYALGRYVNINEPPKVETQKVVTENRNYKYLLIK